MSVITFTFSGLWLTGQVNDSSIGTHLEMLWFRLVELDSIVVSVFVVVLVEFDKYYQKQIQISTDGETSRLVQVEFEPDLFFSCLIQM